MGVTVGWSEPALQGLEEALGYIGFDHPAAARRLARNLPRFPSKGRMIPEYRNPLFRERLVGPFMILFSLVDPACLKIIAVVRAERLLDPGLPDLS